MKYHVKLAKEGKINANASLRDRQSIVINAPIKKIWDILLDIESWPKWNEEITSTSRLSESDFKWKMKGQVTSSSIQLIEEPNIVSWTGQRPFLKAILVWKMEATDDDQTVVTAEESVQGLATLVMGHQKLHSSLIHWLEYMKERAEKST